MGLLYQAMYHNVGLVVNASVSRAADQEFDSRLSGGDFQGLVIQVTSKLALQWRLAL